MLDLHAYKVIHLLGIFALFVAMGGLTLHAINGGDKTTNLGRKLVSISHGVALLLVLVSGFGMLAKLGMPSGVPLWAWIKVGLWVVMGGLLVVPMKLPKLARPLFLLLPVVGALAGAVAIYKPFS